MGFFKKLFKKKKGGTFFGNLLRGASNKLSGGVLGNGTQLAKNDAKIEQAEYKRMVAQQNAGRVLASAHPQYGKVANLTANLKKDAEKNWIKENWAKVAGAVVAVVALTIGGVKLASNSKPKRRR